MNCWPIFAFYLVMIGVNVSFLNLECYFYPLKVILLYRISFSEKELMLTN